MRYQLKDYQDDAARAVLERLEQCREDYHRRGERFSFALSATTGAGKTVIAATVIEALIHGSTEFDVEADPGAVVLWISKDPALNEQTRHRIIEAADRVPVGDLVLLDKDFAGEKLEKGTVYFINPAKLASSSLFVRKTNARQFTFWEILDNTIRDDQLTLYVILDEAHEGMKAVRRDEAEERQTIVQKIINGNGTNLPVPIVWGISATPERFTTAMASATERTAKSNVVIDPVRVQASGLLKNTLVLDIPDEKGDFETSMLRDGTIEFVAQSARWADYCAAEGEDVVTPLLVVQLPNKETGAAGEKAEDRLIATTLNVIRGAFPEFTDDCVAHVLGDRGDLEINGIPIPKVKPQDIQNDPTVRVLLAKDAVSTGWDCPRAEVLVSLRPARDKTYITQLLGRMVRTPLARSTNDDRLNSASCFLPHFDRPTAKAVSEEIMGIAKSRGGEPPLPPGPKVIFQPVDLAWNEKVPEEVRELLESLPSLPKPAAAPKPVKRAIDAATAMAVDGFVDKPNDQLMSSLFGVLDGAAAQYAEDVEQISAAIMEAEVRRFTTRHGDSSAQTSHMVREADENTVKEALGSTRRILGAAVVTGYLKKLYQQALTADGITADLVSIDARVAALSRIERNGEAVVVKALQDTAETQTRAWLEKYHGQIKLLGDARQAVYDDIRGQAREPELTPTELRTYQRVEGGTAEGEKLPRYPKHVLADGDGQWPLDPKFTSWEKDVLAQELDRSSVVAWYRNPSDAGKHSIRVPYRKDGLWKSLQPDFIFFDTNAGGQIVPSIVDPHSGSFTGALERLEGLARYAEEHGAVYARIDAIDEGRDKTLRSLDLKDPAVRAAILAAEEDGKSAADLFNGPQSRAY